MTAKSAIQLVVALALFGAAGAIAYNTMISGGPVGDGPLQGEDWQCLNDECGAVFHLTPEQVRLVAKDPEGIPTCPECGKRLVQPVYICPHCGEAIQEVGHGGVPETCPECGQSLLPGG